MKSHSCSFWYKIIKSGCSPGVGRLPWEQEAARSNRATRTNASGTAVPEAFFAIFLFSAAQFMTVSVIKSINPLDTLPHILFQGKERLGL